MELKEKIKDKLIFASRAADTAPGCSKYKAEVVGDKNHVRWNPLKSMKNWRQVLSSFYVEPMLIDGLTFRTMEHYLQYRKAAIGDSQRALEFTIESSSKLGLGEGKDARKARKMVKLSEAQWQEWLKLEASVKEKGKQAKFAPGTFCHKVLFATNDAELWHFAPRCPLVRMKRTEELRDQLVASASHIH